MTQIKSRETYDEQVMHWLSNRFSNRGTISLRMFLKICFEHKVLMQQQTTLTGGLDNPKYQIILILDERVFVVRLKFLSGGFDTFRYFILYQETNIFVRLIFPLSLEPGYDEDELQDLQPIKHLL
jgi:hypothetical protein